MLDSPWQRTEYGPLSAPTERSLIPAATILDLAATSTSFSPTQHTDLDSPSFVHHLPILELFASAEKFHQSNALLPREACG